MAVNDFTNQNIQDTYQKVIQTDGTNVADGTGSALPIKFDGPDLIVSGALIAQSYIVSESVLNVSSGSTVFGDTDDDSHTFIGAISTSFAVSSSTGITASSALFRENVTASNAVTSTKYTASKGFHVTAHSGHEFTIVDNHFNMKNFATHKDLNFLTTTGEGTINFGTNNSGAEFVIGTGGHITSSGNISSSGTITTETLHGALDEPTGLEIVGYMSASGPNGTGSFTSKLFCAGDITNAGNTEFGEESPHTHTFVGNVTSSYNISFLSASFTGNITASNASFLSASFTGNITASNASFLSASVTDITASRSVKGETFTSTMADGTTPMHITSRTVVANLNADKLDGADLIDEDDMASNSTTKIPTQQSVKTYVDTSTEGISQDGSAGFSVGGNFTISNPNHQYSYQYISFFGAVTSGNNNSGGPYYIFTSGNGISNHSWTKYNIGNPLAITNATIDLGVDANCSQLDVSTYFGANQIVVPQTSEIVGFYATNRSTSNGPYHVGNAIFVIPESGVNWGDSTAMTAFLKYRSISSDHQGKNENFSSGGVNTSKVMMCHDMNRGTYEVAAGSIIIPAMFCDTVSQAFQSSMTIVTRTKIQS